MLGVFEARRSIAIGPSRSRVSSQRHHGKRSPRSVICGGAKCFSRSRGLITGGRRSGVASLVNQVVPGGPKFHVRHCMWAFLGLTMLYTIPGREFRGHAFRCRPNWEILYLGLIGSILVVLYMFDFFAVRMPPRGTFAVAVLAACCAIVLILSAIAIHRHQPDRTPGLPAKALISSHAGARLFRRFFEGCQ